MLLTLALGLLSPMPEPAVDSRRLMATVRKLASWQNRNTNNETLTEAASWIADEYRKIPGIQVEIMRYKVDKGQRIREDKEVVQVVATLPGETSRRVLMGGHFDTIAMPLPGWDAKSPGANDDASGVAATLECARLMAGQKWHNTLVFIAFSGEEQGLLGARALAARAKAEKWDIEGFLNNDTVGSSHRIDGTKEKRFIRVFSTDAMPEASTGSARELARHLEWTCRGKVKGFGVKLVLRNDRFGRGGDHTPFMQAGFPAVRLTEAIEEYARQHTNQDLPEFVDARYLANVTRINHLGLQALANSGPPPTTVRIDRAQGSSTTLTWKATKGTSYTVYWRETLSPVWQKAQVVGEVSKATVSAHKDDFEFAVGASTGVPVAAS
jgi:hypothetical protein